MDSEPSPSLWHIKPWWCQPWSILLTGIVVPTLAWLVTHRLWIVIPIAAAILLWWWLFLYVVPKGYAEAQKLDHASNIGNTQDTSAQSSQIP